jgi:hypothetical protein
MNKPFDHKFVAFIGTFEGGSLSLKDLVYEAGGAPLDCANGCIDYLVVGLRGENTQAYHELEDMRQARVFVELTSDEIRDICVGKIPAPQPKPKYSPSLIVSTSAEAEKHSEELAEDYFQIKRDAFEQKHGILQRDGSRLKIDHRSEEILEK